MATHLVSYQLLNGTLVSFTVDAAPSHNPLTGIVEFFRAGRPVRREDITNIVDADISVTLLAPPAESKDPRCIGLQALSDAFRRAVNGGVIKMPAGVTSHRYRNMNTAVMLLGVDEAAESRQALKDMLWISPALLGVALLIFVAAVWMFCWCFKREEGISYAAERMYILPDDDPVFLDEDQARPALTGRKLDVAAIVSPATEAPLKLNIKDKKGDR